MVENDVEISRREHEKLTELIVIKTEKGEREVNGEIRCQTKEMNTENETVKEHKSMKGKA